MNTFKNESDKMVLQQNIIIRFLLCNALLFGKINVRFFTG